MDRETIGIIGGSGLYELPDFEVTEQIALETPWGVPSSEYVKTRFEDRDVIFLARHGKGHRVLPHEVNSPANIAGFKHLGVQSVIAFSAVGSLREELKPLDFVLPDQLIDRTRARPSTFFGKGVAGHVSFADPYCARLQDVIKQSAGALELTMHEGETLVCIDGPTFSTRAESLLYRSWGCGLVNMSALPEARLAREAGICYALICMVTDYDCWRSKTDDVEIGAILDNLRKNADNAGKLAKKTLDALTSDGTDCSCRKAAKQAVITAPKYRSAKQEERLRYILGDGLS